MVNKSRKSMKAPSGLVVPAKYSNFISALKEKIGAVEKQLRHPEDRPTIGILLCKTKKQLKVEYAIGNLKNPISVSSYELIVKSLPKELKPSIPTVAQIEAELSTIKIIDKEKKSNRRKK